MSRKPLSVSGLLQAGVIKRDDQIASIEEFGPATSTYESPVELPVESSVIVQKIDINLIDGSPYQPRITYDQAALQELADSMLAAGQQEPVKVRQKNDGRYELISGHRRRLSAALIGLPELDAYVVKASDAEAQRSTLLANEARENLTDYERAKLYQLAMALGLGGTQKEVAAYFGTSQGRVSRCMAMLTLPEEYLERLEKDSASITANEAAEIREQLRTPKPETISELPAKIKNSPLPRRPSNVVTSAAGRPLFAARSAGREISVRISDMEIDAEIVKEAIMETLRTLAESQPWKK